MNLISGENLQWEGFVKLNLCIKLRLVSTAVAFCLCERIQRSSRCPPPVFAMDYMDIWCVRVSPPLDWR